METRYNKQGGGFQTEMITVNGWCAVGKGDGGRGNEGGGECSINGGDGERLLSKLSPTVS